MDTILINSLLYKIGRHSKVFVMLDDEWILSSVTVEEVEAAFERRERNRELRALREENSE